MPTCVCECNGYCTNCTCITNCTVVCSHVCETVGNTGSWTIPGTQKLVVSYWGAIKSAVDAWLANWSFAASPASVVANARVLASDWNVKVRDQLNQTTYTYSGGTLTANSLGVATATTGTKVTTSGTRGQDLLSKINGRRCTTVYSSKVYASCTSNILCTCNGNCDCDYS